MTARIEKTVFISYRRTNLWTALAVFQNLHSNGYDVFFDYKSIPSGNFEQAITENVRSRAHFIIILSSSALERCNEPGDWLRREIETAIDAKRNIIPLMMEGFDFGSSTTAKVLTGKLVDLKKYNALGIPAEYFDEAMAKLRSERFLNRPLESVAHPVSEVTTKITEAQQTAANNAAPVEKEELSAQEWFERGYIYHNSGNLNESVRCYSESIRLNPDFVDAYGNRGIVLFTKGNSEQAIQDLEKVMILKPDDPKAYYNRGIIRKSRGDLDGAIEDYSEAIKLDPLYAEAYNNRAGAFFAKDEVDRAIKDVNEAIRIQPNNPEAFKNRGSAHRIKGNLEQAIKDYDEAINLKPDFSEAYYNRGLAFQIIGEFDKALRNYQESIRFKPNDGTIRSSLIVALRKLGKITEADEQEVITRELMAKENEYNRACFEVACGNVEKALDLLKIGIDKEQVSKKWARQDPDFESLHSDPRFIKLVDE